MPLRALACMLFAALAIAASGACSSETILLASLPATDAGTPPPLPSRCVTNGDCADDLYYCSLPSCGATGGTCTLAPVVCPDTEQPVCGCDDITYFNDCLRQANGIGAASAQTPCMLSPTLCGGSTGATCPDGALCAQLGLPHGPCSDDIPGTCWVVPAKCPTTPSPDRWDSCDPDGPTCVDTCEAISQQGAYRRSQVCPP